MERGDTHAVVLQRANIYPAFEGIIGYCLDGVEDGDIHVLQDAGEVDFLELWRADVPVGVHADEHGAALLAGSRGAKANRANRASDGQDNVRALVHQGLGKAAAIVG